MRLRAAHHGCSTEAEVRASVESVVMPAERVTLGTLLFEMGRRAGLTDEDVSIFDAVRDRTPAESMSFE